MSKHLTLEEGKRLLEEYGLHQVVIIGRRVGEDGYVNVLTHGTDMAHSAVAARIGECLKTEVMGWPEAHEAEVGERVRLARAAPKMVEAKPYQNLTWDQFAEKLEERIKGMQALALCLDELNVQHQELETLKLLRTKTPSRTKQ